MKRTIFVVLAVLGGGVLFVALFMFAMAWAVLAPPALPDRFVLEVNLQSGLLETTSDDPLFLALERGRTRTRDVVEALEAAAGDPRVAGLLVRGGGGLPGWATAEELRESVARFRASGKPALYFTETFGEFSPGQLSYYLATAFDEIHIQPSGEVGLTALAMEAPFLRGALDRLEVEPRFDRRAEFKDASEMYTETGFTPAAREARLQVLNSVQGSLIAAIAEGRAISHDSARVLVETGPYMAREASAAGLVDGLGYLDGARDRVIERGGGADDRIGLSEYRARGLEVWSRGPRVALVYGVGTILRGEGGYDPFSGASSLGSASVAAALRGAVADERVRAILFRVDSPGGSWVASDQIRREVRRAREAGKPVVVSMGDLAASGGYVISMDADRIVAHPSTFTGSIGVVGGRIVTEEFFESIGITFDLIEAGPNAAHYAAAGDFTPEAWEHFQRFLDRVYEDFVGGVAEGRGMTFEEAEAVARGRVWTGRDALDHGLVDRLGGFPAAMDELRELLELDAGAPLQVAVYPAERTLFQLLMAEGRGVGVSGGGLLGGSSAAVRVFGLVQPLLRRAAEVGLLDAPGPVRMPVYAVPGR